MTTEQLRDVIIGTLTRIAPEVEPDTIRSDAPLRDQLDLDSMDYLNFLIGLHERLGVDIPEADYARLSTVDEIAAYLASKLDARAERPAR